MTARMVHAAARQEALELLWQPGQLGNSAVQFLGEPVSTHGRRPKPDAARLVLDMWA
jgi:hypothetical protein